MKSSSLLLDYFLLPVAMFAICGLVIAIVYENDTVSSINSVYIMFYLFGMSVFAYETGYKKFHMYGRKKYFYVVFVLPILIAAGVYMTRVIQ